MSGERVLIVGAGIAGLAAARALARIDFAVDVVERERAWTAEGAGIYLPGNAIRELRLLGLDQAALTYGVFIPRQRFSDHHGGLLFEVDVSEMWDGIGVCMAMHRADLHVVLLDGARDVAVRMGVQVQSLRDTGDRVRVEFDDDTGGEYELVVGADGINSSVRRLVFGDHPFVRRVGQVGWRFITACPAEVTTWSVMLGSRTSFLTIPIGGERVYCYCDIASTAHRHGRDELDRLFSSYAEPVPSLIASASEPYHGPIEETALDSWSRGRVLLVGDAAHATSPNMAEGAAMALEDAVVLADCLGRASSTIAGVMAFEARRRISTDVDRS